MVYYTNQQLFSPEDGFAITPSDSTVIAATRGIWVGGAGNLAVTMGSGAVLTFAGVAAGTLLPIQVQKVMATNTTATLILGLI
jgi:hypothetical protein